MNWAIGFHCMSAKPQKWLCRKHITKGAFRELAQMLLSIPVKKFNHPNEK